MNDNKKKMHQRNLNYKLTVEKKIKKIEERILGVSNHRKRLITRKKVNLLQIIFTGVSE